MLIQPRLTSEKSTRRVLTTFRDQSARRAALATLGVCLVFGGEIEFVAADAPERPRSSATAQRQETRRNAVPRRPSQPVYSQSLSSKSPPTKMERDEVERELAQLEFQFQETRKIGSERLDQLTAQTALLLDSARRLATQPAADSELARRAEALVAQLETFRRFIDDSSDFFRRLAQLDAASLDAEKTRSFFASFLTERAALSNLTPYFDEVSASSETADAPLDAYRTELRRVAASLEALQTLETWNDFVETNASNLERFYVAPDDAENALAFIAQTKNWQGLPKEFQVLERRAAEWRFTSLNRVAIQRKILLALEAELETKYWTFAATPDKIYYLQQPPRPGRNVCFANSQGERSLVDVPENAPEIAISESTQRQFLQSLASEARSIPETLRADDAARWYAAWSAFFSRLQTTDSLDPLVQFRLLQTVASTLSTGDFYFAQRLAPTLRMLNVPRLSEAGALDVFQAENLTLQELRNLARSRIAFLPTDRLTVDKTTEELDAQTERFSFIYRQVGWLDRDFSGAWRCRRPENAPLPAGDLYVLLAAPNNLTEDGAKTSDRNSRGDGDLSESATRFRWLKIGSSDGRQTTLKLATPNVCRGSIVLCRSRVDAPESVAEVGELERLLRR